jgi:predicted LPLAT superfamily acyltransferase
VSAQWKQRPEAGSAWLVRFMRWVALKVSTRVARGMLYPITLYFLIVRGPERRASRNYLRRALRVEPRLLDIARHIHTFAVCILDRVAFLSGRSNARIVRVHGSDHVQRHLQQGRGALLFGTHLGSFDVVRHVAFSRPDVVVRILMDYQQNPQLTSLLDALNPRARASVIDAGEESTRVLLCIHETLRAGGLVGVLADRPHPGDATVPARLLGGTIALPISPFRLAAVTGVPVVLIFGLLKADGTYDVYFEPFAERIEIRRGQREADAEQWARQFAERLEARIHEAPFNWFNFYDYWRDEQPTQDRS